MSNWKTVPLGQLCEIKIGGTPSRAEPKFWATEKQLGFPWVSISDLREKVVFDTQEEITVAGVRSSNVKLIPRDTVLMSFKLTIGRVARAGRDLYTNEAIAAFVPKSSNLNIDYLFHTLPSVASSGIADTAVKGATLNKAKLINLLLPLPESAEQNTIASVLNQVDTVIDHTESLISKYQSIKQGMMHDLFTRGVDENGELRPPYEEAPELYKKTELGWVPKDWDESPLLDVVPKAEYGISVSLDDGHGIPVLRMNNLENGLMKLDDLKYCTSPEAGELRLCDGDVLFNRTNSLEHVGKTAIWQGELPLASFASYLVRLVPTKEKLLPDFLNLWLNRAEIQTRIRQFATPGVHQVNINPTNLRRVEMARPRQIDEQKKIVARVSDVLKIIESETACLIKLQAIKSGLMHDLLSGKVRVPFTQSNQKAA